MASFALRFMKMQHSADLPSLIFSCGGRTRGAPNAAVVIGQLGGRTHAGQIAAKSITIHQGTHFIWVKEGEYVSTPTVVVRNW